jgi:hypothetical protein
MKSLPFSKPGRWFRGNLHTHSTRSDGTRTPAQVCAANRRRGYDFLSLTDHFLDRYDWPITDTNPFRAKGFTTIIGAELHAPRTSLGDPWHILAVGLPADFAKTRKSETGPRLAQRARDAGAYVAVAHAAWYDLTDRDVLSIKAAHAIEVFNTTCARHNGKGDSNGTLDRLLSQGHRYHAIATDDAHFSDGRPDGFMNWVMVRAGRPNPEALLAALHKGHFYSSQGPEIRTMKITGKTLRLTTSPVRYIGVSSRGAGCVYVNAPRDISTARIDLSGMAGSYGRLTVMDKNGRKAWTNPFWL